LAVMILDIGVEVRPSSHDHADAFDLHVDNARAMPCIAYLPLDRDRLAVALIELAVVDGDPVAPLRDPAHSQRLPAIAAEALGVGMRLRARRRLQETLALLGRGLVPMDAQRRA